MYLKWIILLLLISLLWTQNVDLHTHTPREKADIERILHKLKQHVDKLKQVLIEKYPNDMRTKRFVKRWTGDIREMPHNENTRAFAYNMNKGEHIAVCLHDRYNRFNEFNALFFVTMHELTHIMTKEYTHDDFFWDSFAWLIGVASEAGLYRNIDYEKRPQRYCNHMLNDNPFFSKI